METNTRKWEEMTWQEKREERFNHWLNPENVAFKDEEAEKLYKERVSRFIKALKLEEADRVPVMLPSGTFPVHYYGTTFRIMMYDYEVMKRAWIKFMDDFGDMDSYMGPLIIPCGKIAEAMDSRGKVKSVKKA